jgi:nucleoside-diphosphate-sugar epimerase
MKPKILIIGACGQIGSELTFKLRERYGAESVIASDISKSNPEVVSTGIFEIIDAQDKEGIRKCIEAYEVDTVYLMAAMLSATGEQFPQKTWDLNINSLFNVLDLAKAGLVNKVFWPSSIAVFGATTPKMNTPQHTVTEPTTVYGMTKLVGERLCEYYYNHYGTDVRSLRYPGIISWRTEPGGGTTDYAIDIFHKAISEKRYKCFLKADAELPMMFMDDAIDATIEIMEADSKLLSVRSSYNLAAVSFTPKELGEAIKGHIPDFEITYDPDYRQEIAETWPCSIDDSRAREDWNWSHRYNLEAITKEMITQLSDAYSIS